MKFKELTSNATKNLLKLKAGEEVRGILKGDPIDFRQHWVDNRSSICTGRDTCELCKAGEKSSFRFRVNLIVNENGAYVAKIFEQGRAVYEALKALNADYDLEKHLIKIKRLGSGTETQYSVLPVPNGEIKNGVAKAVNAVQLNDLSLTNTEVAEAASEAEEEDEETPF